MLDTYADENEALLVQRKSNSKRRNEPYQAFLKEYMRKAVETEFTVLTALMPSTIHAVTSQGFQIKLLAFIVAFSINKAFDLNIWQLESINNLKKGLSTSASIKSSLSTS